MIPTIDLQVACESEDVPDPDSIQRWITAALRDERAAAEISVRIVDSAECRELNHRYRDKDKPTNVLSFPADLPPELELPLLGDLVICAPVVVQEAREQHKTPDAHWAHMLVHGTLHLLGYDHIEDREAERMEALETEIITQLGYPPPYTPIAPSTNTIGSEMSP